jgi:hypothetical protein
VANKDNRPPPLLKILSGQTIVQSHDKYLFGLPISIKPVEEIYRKLLNSRHGFTERNDRIISIAHYPGIRHLRGEEILKPKFAIFSIRPGLESFST